MGRDWYNLGGGGGGCKSGEMMKKQRGCRFKDDHGDVDEDSYSSSSSAASTASGCMTAVSQFFDFHLRILPTHNNTDAAAHDRRRHHPPPSSAAPRILPPRPPRHIPKGLEAPRNSLEEDAFGPSCSNAIHQSMLQIDNLSIPMGRIQIKTSKRGEDNNNNCTARTPRESSTSDTKKALPMYSSSADNNGLCSPGPKTPNLVARLMGLDASISPSPPPSHSTSQRLSYPRRRSCSDSIASGARSLPETPRVSSERRSDVDRHHRFSLQINKENHALLLEHDSMSPRNYAKQILKQVKERVGRRVGMMDITNTVNNNKEEIVVRRDENLLGSRSNSNKENHQQQPRVNSSKKIINSIKPLTQKPSTSFQEAINLPAPQKKAKQEEEKRKPPVVVNKKCKKVFAGNSMMMLRKKEEPFVRADKRCKKATPLSLSNNDLQSFLSLHVKKDPSPPTPPATATATKLPLKQALSDDARCSKFSTTPQLSRGSSHNDHRELGVRVSHKRHVHLENTLHGSSSQNELGLMEYLAALLRRIGISKDTRLVSLSRWFYASHCHRPLDPSIFHYLELAFSASVTGQLSLRCNRRLTFDLVGEILGNLLSRYVKLKAAQVTTVRFSPCTMWHDPLVHGGSGQLIDQMYGKMVNFPQANCQTLQDIDALIDMDLKSNVAQNVAVAFEEEGGAIVSEIERDILETLVNETAAFFGGDCEWTCC